MNGDRADGDEPKLSAVTVEPPVELTSFIGRRDELGELVVLVGERRLVTITGPGGCGKTRLAAAVLADARDRRREAVGWIDLASVDDAADLVDAVAAALGVPVGSASDPSAALAAGLRDRRLLACLDNCEHVIEASCDLAEVLLRACPELSIVATSREPLGTAAEVVWRVPPMDEDEVLALFADRTRSARADFALDAHSAAAVRTMGRRLDGIPLAIEFAAAWVRSLTPSQIAAAIDDRFQILGGSHRRAVPRQRTLLTSVQWSYDLLRDDARTLLPRLAVFVGRFTLEDVLGVCADERFDGDRLLSGLARLVDTSMIATEEHGGVVHYRLSETIREFAADRLADAGETASVRDRHLSHFAALAEAAAVDLDEGDQDSALARFAAVGGNLRAALDWGLGGDDPTAGRRLAAAVARMWVLRGRAREGIPAVQRAIDCQAEDTSPLQARLLAGLSMLAMSAGRMDLSVEAAARAVDLARPAGDLSTLARATGALGYVPCYTDYPRCEALGREAEAHGRAAGDGFALHFGLLLQAVSLSNRDRHEDAAPLAEEVLAWGLARNDRFLAFAYDLRMYGALLTGDVRRALELGRAGEEFARPLGDYFVHGTMTSDLAWATGLSGDIGAALRMLGPLMRSIDRAGPDVDVIDVRGKVGEVLLWAGELDEALAWLHRAADFDEPGVDNWTAMGALAALSGVLRRLGRQDAATTAAERGLEMARRLGTPHAEAESLDALAELLVDSEPGRAESLLHEALSIRSEHALRTHLTDSLDALARLVARRDDHEQAARLIGASNAARLRVGYPRPRVDWDRYESFAGDLRAALGTRFDDLVAEGAVLDLDAAVAYATRARGPRGRPSLGWDSLTPTEREVVVHVAEGLTNPQIAERLFVSRATVKTHLSHIFTKVGVSTRAELAVAASRQLDTGAR